ncbi:hypothetical protein BT96DRAFT_998002 [Gymnopus androsaceus JB14]|uniref:F-box domain-containing protein n=1 Tax=Gymnopus androsaceus JB14 TaxID=1447944 RepID=A0A6A4HCI1_9AGAR|nr:hypothetical protein BT96DRAFT_998002 [Gymnopus androsaceus JB14]
MTGNQPAYLPLELKRQIIDLCTPTTLRSLALVSKLFQAESEVALYRHIFVHLDPQDRVLSNALKAWISDSVQAGWLYALKELRLDVASTDRYTADAIQKLLNVKERHFRLHRLYCRLQGNLPAVIGLPAVTEAHSDSLRILTVTRTGDLDSLVDATVRIARAHPALVIFAYCYLVLSDVLIIFPGALSPEQGFMSYIDNETDCSDVGEVRLYLADTMR